MEPFFGLNWSSDHPTSKYKEKQNLSKLLDPLEDSLYIFTDSLKYKINPLRPTVSMPRPSYEKLGNQLARIAEKLKPSRIH